MFMTYGILLTDHPSHITLQRILLLPSPGKILLNFKNCLFNMCKSQMYIIEFGFISEDTKQANVFPLPFQIRILTVSLTLNYNYA